MEQTIMAKLAGLLWEALKWSGAALVGLLVWIFKRQDAKIKKLQEVIAEMRENVVYKHDLDEKADSIEAKVKSEHERIIAEVQYSHNRIHDLMREDLQACNQAVMNEVRQIREFMFNHLERRGKPRDEN